MKLLTLLLTLFTLPAFAAGGWYHDPFEDENEGFVVTNAANGATVWTLYTHLVEDPGSIVMPPTVSPAPPPPPDVLSRSNGEGAPIWFLGQANPDTVVVDGAAIISNGDVFLVLDTIDGESEVYRIGVFLSVEENGGFGIDIIWVQNPFFSDEYPLYRTYDATLLVAPAS